MLPKRFIVLLPHIHIIIFIFQQENLRLYNLDSGSSKKEVKLSLQNNHNLV
jgi:hypothetical protein